jgi:hypothetical protein
MPKDLIFINSVNDLDEYSNDILSSSINIALCPKAQHKLTRMNIPYENSLKYLKKKNSANIVISVENILKLIDGNVGIEDELEMRDSYENLILYEAQLFLNELFLAIEIISNVIQTHKPKKIIVIGSSAIMIGRRFSSIKLSFCKLVQLFVEANSLSIEVTSCNKIKYQHIKTKWFRWPLISRLLFNSQLLIYKYITSDRKILMASEDTYNMLPTMSAISNKIGDTSLVYLNTRVSTFKNILNKDTWIFGRILSTATKKQRNNFSNQYHNFVKYMDSESISNNDALTYKGLNIQVFLVDYLNNYVNNMVDNLHGHSHSLLRILKINIPFMILSQHSLGFSSLLGELSSKLGIPAISISHGTHTFHGDKHAQIAWKRHSKMLLDTLYPFTAIQSPLANIYLDKTQSQHSKKVITGPVLYAKESSISLSMKNSRTDIYGVNSDKLILLHASTPRASVSFRPWVYETIDEYVRNINDLIEVVEDDSNIHLAIRFRPLAFYPHLGHSGFSKIDLKNLLKPSSCYEIYTDGEFYEYLGSSDILVSYSSTTIEESFQGKVPVLQYDADNKYMHIPNSCVLEINKDPELNIAYYAGSKNNLKWGINWMKDNLLELNDFLASTDKLYDYIYKEDANYNWVKKVTDYYEK